MTTGHLRVALASKGAYEASTAEFLSRAGLGYQRPNSRQYVGRMAAVPEAEILFQRPEDIVHKVADGSADLGITGYDLVAEHAADNPDVHVILPGLGFRHCQVVIAVPDSWLDITSIGDLAELSIDLKRRGRPLRIATKFTNLVSEHLYRHGVNYFSLTAAHGALEAAPTLGYADAIADLTETGVTLRDNHLRVLEGGVVLRAQACLIGNVRSLADGARLQEARVLIELIEAKLQSRAFRVITANVAGGTAESVAARIMTNVDLAGETGPTVSRVFPKVVGGDEAEWFAVSVIVPDQHMLATVDHLRAAGARGIIVGTPDYMFETASTAYLDLADAVQRRNEEAGRPWS